MDQAGFRSGFGCEDHLFTVVMVVKHVRQEGTGRSVAVYGGVACDVRAVRLGGVNSMRRRDT